MINQMSSSMRNFMEAYSAVHNKEAKEEFYSHKDEISEMDFSLINQTELNDIAEEVLEELFEEGYSVEQCEAIFEEVLTEARVTYGSDTESPRAKKMSAVKSSLKGAMGKVKEKAAKGAVKSYGAYRSAKQAATDKAARVKQSAVNMSAQTVRKAKDAKAGIKSGIKGMIGNAAKKVGGAANKVSSRMSEGAVRKDVGDIYQAIYEKKKLDAVGKEDGDIDNDGDEDSSDNYLANRRKAIGKSMGKKGKCEKCGKDPCECDKKEVEEGYKELPKNKMFRKAGNLGRDAISTPIDPEKRQKAYDRSKKIVKTLNKANEEFEQIDEVLNPKVNLPFGGDKITHNYGGAGAAIGGAAAAGLGAGAMALANKMKKKKEKKEEGKIQEVVALPALGAAAALGAAGGLASGIAGTVGAKMTRKAIKNKKEQEVQESKLKSAIGGGVGDVVGKIAGGIGGAALGSVAGPVGALAGAAGGAKLGGAAGAATGAALGAKKGRKKSAAAAAGGGSLVAGTLGAATGGALASEYIPTGVTFSEAELKAFEDIVNSWED